MLSAVFFVERYINANYYLLRGGGGSNKAGEPTCSVVFTGVGEVDPPDNQRGKPKPPGKLKVGIKPA